MCRIAHNAEMSKQLQSKAKRKTKPDAIVVQVDSPRIAPQRVWTLTTFVADDNPSYTQFIAYLGAGATVGAAACSVRLSYPTIADWLAKFAAGSNNPLVNKLGTDIEQAIGQASVVAEVSVKGSSPREWLRVVRNSLRDVNPWNNNSAQVNAVTTPQQTTNNILVIGAQLQHDALAALEQAGIITQRRNTESVAIDARVVDEVSKK